MRRLPILFLLLVLSLTACYSPPQLIVLDASETAVGVDDSLSSVLSRPYGVGFNMVVDVDSLLLLEERPMHWSEGVAEYSDSLWLWRDNNLVVAAITVIPEDTLDSVWVKVARDQFTMGWLHESDLLEAAHPDDPISAFIRMFSDLHTLWFVLVVTLILAFVVFRYVRRQHLCMLHCDDIPSAYPTMLVLTLAACALLYGYIQQEAPHQWVQFYFHPTLNPLSQPPLLCAFLIGVWLLVVLGIASVDNAFGCLRPTAAVLYLMTVLGICAAVYLLFSLTANTFVGYLLFVLYAVFALYRYCRYSRARFICGHCGAKLKQRGRCPHCGTIND